MFTNVKFIVYLFLMRQRCFTALLFFLFVIAWQRKVFAQNKQPWTGFGIEANMLYGKVFKHTPKFKLPIPDHSTAFDLNFTLQTYGKKDWEQRRHFPMVGVGITYTNYGIDSIYGRCIGIYPNLQLPIVRGNKLEWTVRIGMGMGYITRDYQRAPVWDTLNNAIGSKIDNFTIFMTDLRYHVNEHLDIQLGGNFTHVSNASFQQPNLGINMYGAHIGIRYFPVTSKPEPIMRDLEPLKSRWLTQVRAGLAFDGYAAPNGPVYPVYMASLFESIRWHSNNKVFVGIDYSYHTAIYAFLRNNEVGVGSEAQHSWKSAVFAGNEFLFGRVGLVLQLGYYIKEAYLKADVPYYEKLGGNLYLVQKEKGALKELCLSAFLKAHQTDAELVEFGIGAGF